MDLNQLACPIPGRSEGRGLSKSTASSLVEDGLNGLISFSMTPIRIALFAGFSLASLSILVALVMLIINLIYYKELAPSGIPLLTVSLFFFAGFQLFFMGLLGEYILAIHSQGAPPPIGD